MSSPRAVPSHHAIPTSCPHLTTLTLLPRPGPVPLPPTLPSRGQADAGEGEDQSRTMCDCWTKPLSFSCTRQGDEANGKGDKLTPKKRGPWWRMSTGRVGAGGMLTDGRWL